MDAWTYSEACVARHLCAPFEGLYIPAPKVMKMGESHGRTGIELSLALLGIAVVTFGLSYGLNVLLARNLSTEVYGNLVFAFRILGAVSALSLLGTGTSATRFLARYLHYQSTDSVESFLRWNTRIIRWPFLLTVTIGVTTCLAMFCVDLFGFRGVQTYHLAVFMLWIAPLFSIVQLLSAYLLCAGHPIVSTISSQLMVLGVQLVLFSTIFIVFGLQASRLWITGVIGASALFAMVIQIVVLHRSTPVHILDLWPRRKAKSLEARSEWLSVSLWLIVGQLVAQAALLIDVSLLEAAPGRENQLGYYGAALSITYLLFIVPRSMLSPLAAKVSSLLDSAEKLGQLQDEIDRAVRTHVLLVVLLAFPMVFFSKELLASFGTGYEAAQIVLFISIGTALVSALGGSALTVIRRSDMEKRLLGIYVMDLLVLLVLGAVLVGPFGMTGVATALLCSAVARTAGTVFSVRRRYGIKPLSFI